MNFDLIFENDIAFPREIEEFKNYVSLEYCDTTKSKKLFIRPTDFLLSNGLDMNNM